MKRYNKILKIAPSVGPLITSLVPLQQLILRFI